MAPRPLIKRVYEPAATADGVRILVDRLWPRGLSEQKAGVDEWLKDIAPSAALRKWFGHDPARWDEFRRRYQAELADNEAATARLLELARKGPVTLVYAARDSEHNNAVVLADFVQQAASDDD
ncbi:DUF488 domain-containing protein [Devosia sp.]|uniref:DUF488 domain-containing protein n=1 Tax=Devosia sp. TaxID=1871048 RepID=UPI002EE54CEA